MCSNNWQLACSYSALLQDNDAFISGQFSVEVETKNVVQFMDILIGQRGPTLTTKSHRQPKQNGGYRNYNFNHPSQEKEGFVSALQKRVAIICQEKQELTEELDRVKRDVHVSNCHLQSEHST